MHVMCQHSLNENYLQYLAYSLALREADQLIDLLHYKNNPATHDTSMTYSVMSLDTLSAEMARETKERLKHG